MSEKKSNSFVALLLTVVVAVAVTFGVKAAGGTGAAPAETAPVQQPAVSQTGEAGDSQAPAGKYAAGSYTATATGMGELTVTVTIGDGDVITEVTVDGPGETAGIGTNAIEQLPGAIVEAQSAEVDTVSGATITSNAILTAASDCLAQAEAGAGGASAAPAGDDAGAAGAYKPGSYTAEATGMGKVTVTVTVGDDGAIAEVAVDGPSETAGIGTNAIEQLPGAIVEAQSAEVDGVSGATITSQAIMSAVQDCLNQAAN